MAKTSILEKLKKLKALADNPAATRAEAELALVRMNEIALNHGIEVSNLELSELGDIHEEEYTVKNQKMKLKWIEQLALACSRMFEGYIVVNRRLHCTSFTFLGFRDDIPAMKYLFEHLYESWKTIVEADLKSAKLYSEDSFSPSDTMKFKAGHGAGFAIAIHTRVEKMILDRKAVISESSEDGKRMVIYKGSKMDEYLNNFGERKTKLSSGSEQGMAFGSAAGARIRLGIEEKTLRLTNK